MGQTAGADAFTDVIDPSLEVAGPLFVLLFVVGLSVRIVGIRAFASEAADPIPSEEVTRCVERTIGYHFIADLLVKGVTTIGVVAFPWASCS